MTAGGGSKWKLGVALLVLLPATWLIYRSLTSGGDGLSGRIAFVCVETGEEFWLARDEVPAILPAAHPQTTRRTLLPFEVDGRAGTRRIRARFREVLDDPSVKELNHYVDPQTLEVRGD